MPARTDEGGSAAVTERAEWRGSKFGAMSPAEVNDFLAGPWIARTACLKPDGSPYVFAAWYHWDGVAFWLVPRARSAWAHYLATDPRVSLVVDEPQPPIRQVGGGGPAPADPQGGVRGDRRLRRGRRRAVPGERGDVGLEQDRHLRDRPALP